MDALQLSQMRLFGIGRIHTACLQNRSYVLLIEHKQSPTVGSPRLAAKPLQKVDPRDRLLCLLSTVCLEAVLFIERYPQQSQLFLLFNRLIEQFQLKLLFPPWKAD